MKIGIIDSGLGGLIILKSMIEKMPEYDYVYFGDTLHIPYGEKSREEVYEYVLKIVDYLFSTCDCAIIVIACNTATSIALKKLQQEYLPKYYPDRKILGVIIPTIEMLSEDMKKVGVIATTSTVKSKVYSQEIYKYFGDKIEVFEQAAPLLATMIENNDLKSINIILKEYLQPLIELNINTLILGCTHYPLIRSNIKSFLPNNIKIISQDEFMPDKLKDYLNKHDDVAQKLSKNSKYTFLVSYLKESYINNINTFFNNNGYKIEEIKF